jgi:hypothetical protein
MIGCFSEPCRYGAASATQSLRLLRQIISRVRSSFPAGNSFDCAAGHVVLSVAGAQRIFAMIETVTAFLGLFSAGIFIAHAFEGFRSRA